MLQRYIDSSEISGISAEGSMLQRYVDSSEISAESKLIPASAAPHCGRGGVGVEGGEMTYWSQT